MNVTCQIGRSSYPEECIFYLDLPDGSAHIGATAREYCSTRLGQPLQSGRPLPGQVIAGLVAVKLLRVHGENGVLVSLPDGAVVVVRKDQVRRVKK
jgi:hypothetical protein